VKDASGKRITLLVREAEESESDNEVGTGHGSERSTDLRGVQRNIGALREVVSLRYKRPKAARSESD
jgi:hypothetical protein